MRRTVERYGDVALRRRSRGVFAYHNVTESYHLIHHNVRIEHIATPVGSVSAEKLGLWVLSADEALENSGAVGQTRATSTDNGVIQPERHGTCTITHSALSPIQGSVCLSDCVSGTRVNLTMQPSRCRLGSDSRTYVSKFPTVSGNFENRQAPAHSNVRVHCARREWMCKNGDVTRQGVDISFTVCLFVCLLVCLFVCLFVCLYGYGFLRRGLN